MAGKENFVGFANLPNQVHRRAVDAGFEFTLMVVGESGLGKSTLINSLFLAPIYEDADYSAAGEAQPSTCNVERTTVELDENGINLRLTLVDSPGFGTLIDNDGCWNNIVAEVERAFEQYLDDESRIHRSNISDQRVHCCLYFIAPTGHRLKQLDIEVMKHLQDRVNLVPVIAKADSFTSDELDAFRAQIRDDLEANGINVYRFPTLDDDEEGNSDDKEANLGPIPFAVSSSLTEVKAAGQMTLVRQYPWGVVDIENPEHSEFTKLRDLLLRTHMHDLISSTHTKHYENFRRARLEEMGGGSGTVNAGPSESNLIAQFEKEKELREKKMAKMEAEMSQVFAQKVKEKERKLQDSEGRLVKQHEDMRKEIREKQRLLEQRRKEFEDEQASVNAAKDLANTDKSNLRRKTGVRLFTTAPSSAT